MSGEYSVVRRTLDRPPPGFIPYIGFAKGVRSESEKNPREFGRGKKEGGSFLIFHRVIRIRSVSNNFRNLRRFGFDLIYYYVFYVSRRMTSFVSFLSLSFPASRFFLAENSRGKEDGGELRRTNIYPRRAILFDLQFESSSSEWKKWKCMCVCSRASEREGHSKGGRRIEEVPPHVALGGENAISGKCLSRIYEQIDFRFSDSSFRDRS